MIAPASKPSLPLEIVEPPAPLSDAAIAIIVRLLVDAVEASEEEGA